jgi:hypothetical protein
MILKQLAIGVLGLAFANCCLNSVFAQECDAILAAGVWESKVTESNIASTKQFGNWACNSFKARGNYGPISGEVGTNACNGSNAYEKYDEKKKEEIRKAADIIVTEWGRCMHQIGSFASILFRDDPSAIIVNLTNQGPMESHVQATITASGPIKECHGNDLKIQQKGKNLNIAVDRRGSGVTFLCTRADLSKFVQFLVSFRDGTPDKSLEVRPVEQKTTQAISPKIIRIYAPADEQMPDQQWPRVDSAWDVSFPLKRDDLLGIGHIVDPGVNPRDVTRFAIAKTANANVPDPNIARVTYVFDKPAEIAGVQIYQHANGVLKVKGLVGYSIDDLRSLGEIQSPNRWARGRATIPNGSIEDFMFPDSGTGTVFQFIVTESNMPNGFAVYGAYPLDTKHNRYRADY